MGKDFWYFRPRNDWKKVDLDVSVKLLFRWSLEYVRTRPGHSVDAVAWADQFLLIQSWKINWECSRKKNSKNPSNKMGLNKNTSMLKGNGSFFPFLFCVNQASTDGVSSICPASEFVHEMDGLSPNFYPLSPWTNGRVSGPQTAVFIRGGLVQCLNFKVEKS